MNVIENNDDMISNEWTVRDEILAVAHRWPLPVLAFLLGALLGWAVSRLAPSPYRAEMNLAVAYNSDAIYTNPDDYKNGQLGQLDALAKSSEVIQDTLLRLQALDPVWKNEDEAALMDQLHVSWRNTGVWHLSAEERTPRRASQAVQTWAQVILDQYTSASANAAQVFVLDQQLYYINTLFIQGRWRQLELEGVQRALKEWRANTEQFEAGQALKDLQRWQVWSLVARAADLDPAWKEVLAGLPAESAPAGEYLPWVDRSLVALQDQIEILSGQNQAFEARRLSLKQEYQKVFDASKGLSSLLSVTRQNNRPPQVRPERPTPTLTLIGGVFGLLAWLLAWLAHIAMQKSSVGAPLPVPVRRERKVIRP